MTPITPANPAAGGDRDDGRIGGHQMADDVWLGDRQRRKPHHQSEGADREARDGERALGQHG